MESPTRKSEKINAHACKKERESKEIEGGQKERERARGSWRHKRATRKFLRACAKTPTRMQIKIDGALAESESKEREEESNADARIIQDACPASPMCINAGVSLSPSLLLSSCCPYLLCVHVRWPFHACPCTFRTGLLVSPFSSLFSLFS